MSIRKLFAIVIVCLMSAMTQAQEPVRMEYFLDTDPGYGNGVVITNIQIGDNLLTFDVSTATPGPHVLSVRSQDEAGRWSATLSRSFFIDRLQDITYVEYFIDNDPAVGNGKPLSLASRKLIHQVVLYRCKSKEVQHSGYTVIPFH